MAVCVAAVALFNVPVMLASFVPDAPPVMPPVTVGALQLNVVPAATMLPLPLVGVTINPLPLQVIVV